MKYNIYHIIIGLLAMLLTCGACQDDLEGNSLNGNMLTLQLQTSAITRALEVGEDRFNENVVNRVDVFFFRESSGTATGSCIDAQTGLVPEGSTLQVELNNLTNGNYYIYVVANYNLISETDAEGKSLADLQDIVLTTNWKDGYTEGESVTEESFAMDGATVIEVTDEGATGHVDLTRAMAKIMLYVTTESEIKDDKGLTYEPINDRMFATLVYGVNKTNFAGDYVVRAGDESNDAGDYITRMRRDYDPNHTKEVTVTVTDEDGEEKQEKYDRYEQVAPFYSYPNPVDTENRKDSYLILCVPWMVTEGGSGEGSYQAFNYYYRVPITGTNAPALLERNHYYKVNVHIGVLGSLSPHDAVEIEANFEIVDWFNAEIDADMQQYQYLVLDEYTSVMNNVDELRMPYISSSPLKMESGGGSDTEYTRIVSVSYPNYKEQTTTNVTLTTPEEIKDEGFILEDLADGKELKFTHIIPDDVFVPYTITIQVYNTQGVHISEPWIIRQYPDIYIEADFNTEGQESRFVNGYWNAPNGGGLFGSYLLDTEDDRGNSLNSILNIKAWGYDNDDNENQYTIYITSFEAGQNYVIGDPRTEEPQDITIEDRYGNVEKRFDNLKEYYPTREEGVASMLTPAYKVASSWGGASSMDYETAKARCASYQENGYPAGRWRMPTEAEIDYIVELSANGDIPMLFLLSGSGQYWASSGRVRSGDGWEDSNNRTNAYIRCVYDVWYWGDEKVSELPEDERNGLTDTDFVWGDGGTLRRGDKKN